MINVLLVEDHVLVRMGLALLLEKSEKIKLVGEAEDGLQGVSKAKELRPDVILMDIGLPVIDGITATKRIKEENPNARVLMFTSRDNEKDVFEARAARRRDKGAPYCQGSFYSSRKNFYDKRYVATQKESFIY